MIPHMTAVAVCAGLLVVGCGGAGADVDGFTDACVSSGNLPPEVCPCTAEKAAEELWPDGFNFLVASLSGNDEEAARLRNELDLSEAMAAGTFMARGAAECARELADQ